jgi:hypothetical protein
MVILDTWSRTIADLRALDARQRNAVVASYLGWTLDAFDFFLLVFVLKDIAAARCGRGGGGSRGGAVRLVRWRRGARRAFRRRTARGGVGVVTLGRCLRSLPLNGGGAGWGSRF